MLPVEIGLVTVYRPEVRIGVVVTLLQAIELSRFGENWRVEFVADPGQEMTMFVW